MARPLSATAVQAIYSQETAEVFLALLTIDHESLAQPIRLVHNMENVVSEGNTYIRCAFRVELPASLPNELPKAKIVVDNVDRQIVSTIRTVSGDISVTLAIVLASSPDTTEYGPLEMSLEQVYYDALVVSGTLAPEDSLREPHPGKRITPANFPGVFA